MLHYSAFCKDVYPSLKSNVILSLAKCYSRHLLCISKRVFQRVFQSLFWKRLNNVIYHLRWYVIACMQIMNIIWKCRVIGACIWIFFLWWFFFAISDSYVTHKGVIMKNDIETFKVGRRPTFGVYKAIVYTVNQRKVCPEFSQ